MIFLFGSKLKLLLRENELISQECLSLRAEVSLLQNFLEDERSERKRICDLLFKRFGLISEESPSIILQNKKLSEGVNSWARRKMELERKFSQTSSQKAVTREELDKIIEEDKQNAS